MTVPLVSDGSSTPWRADHLELRLDLGPDDVRVTCVTHVRRADGAGGAPLVLDGRGLTTHEVSVDGEPVALDDDVLGERTLTLHLPGDAHVVRTAVTVRPGAIGDKGITSRDEPALISTNCEPEGFRRITWALDRPDQRATYDVTLVADRSAYPVLLANGDLVEQVDLGGGRHLTRHVDPVPKPSYLFAVVAGDLETVATAHTTRSGRTVELRVTGPRGTTAGAAFGLRTMAEVVAFDEAGGGIEHDLDVLTFVAIPGYPDATEYHGLMFFDASLLVVDPTGWTDDDLLLIMANIAHEYGHHVRGNRVTVRSWGQLAMKEGLTVLTAQNDFRRHVFGPVARVLDVADLRRLQFPEEITIGAPVLRGEVGNPEQLYTRTTYLKGAEVFGMLRTVVGASAWRAAFDAFVARHDLGSAGVDDVVAALRDTRPDVADDVDAVARWFGLAGRPVLSIRTGANAGDGAAISGTTEVHLERTDVLADDPPVAIPVRLGFRRADGRPLPVDVDGAVAAEHLVVLRGRRHTVHLAVDEPVVVSPLLGCSAPVDLETDHDADHLAVLVANEEDAFVRWWASQELMTRSVDAARAGDDASLALHLDLLADALRRTVSGGVEPMLLAQLLAVPDEFVLGDRSTPIDVDGVAAGLDALRMRLGVALHDDLLDVLDRWSGDTVAGTEPADIAKRALVEPCLALLLAAGTPEAVAAAEAQLAHADHTRAVRALAQLMHLQAVPSDRVDAWVAETYERWARAPKLLDRWLRAQSGGRRRDTIARVRSLRDGPLYDRHQRGRVMGLWFPFATRNRSVFHDPGGEGYRLFVDEVIELMPINAGVVIRLVGDLLQYQRFDDHRRALLRDELERMATAPGMPDFAVAIVRGLLTA